MGKAVEKVKKKKGRPSLLDLQKRNLKQQQDEEHRQQQEQQQLRRSHKLQNPNPNCITPTPIRRSTRRNPNPNGSSDEEEEGISSSKRRRDKKLKLVHDLTESSSASDSESGDKKRRIEAIGDGSGQRKEEKLGELQDGSTNPTSVKQDIKLDDGPSTPLPDKKLLLFILDRLQKKDRYSVFAEPVDPEELPDYHEIIDHPMDFSTIRKKLTNDSYVILEQFEKDVYLLCSNAMQYNAPDTIYFRQARTIQELAKKNFENLRQDGDNNETEVKIVRRGRPPTKHLKKPMDKPSHDGAISDFMPAILDTGGESSSQPNYDLRKNNSLGRYASSDSAGRGNYGSRQGEVYISWSSEKYDRADEFLGSMSKGNSMKQGKKQIILEENKRGSYNLSGPSQTSALSSNRGEQKHLIPVGLHTEYGYARSLARFAAKLGPVAWKVACKKIERCLPAGVKFGPGWIGENDTITQSSVTPISSSSVVAPIDMPSCNGSKKLENQEDAFPLENLVESRLISENITAADSSSSPVPKSSPSRTGENVQNSLNKLSSRSSLLQPCVNGVNGTHGFSFPNQMGKLTRSAVSEDEKCHNSSTGKSVDIAAPPDLNEGFQSPDLALQLG